ncbi:MAG: diguanylate cyclase [Chloroflexi bacterium]|nr:diguanylate cyclase [Chloroflexota bacterium]
MNTNGNFILIVEPDDELRNAARRALERKGYTVQTAVDGEDALAQFADTPASVVVASVSMPRRDGLEVLRAVKDAHPATEVILLSDANTIGSASIGLNDGAFTYLIKPLSDLGLLAHTVGLAAHFQHLLNRTTPAAEAMIQTTAMEMIDHLLARATEEKKLQAPATPAPQLEPVRPREFALDAVASQVMRQLLDLTRGDKALAKVFGLIMQASANLFDAPHAAVLLATPTSGLQLYDSLGYADKQAAGKNLIQLVGEDFAWRVAKERKTIMDSNQSTHFIGAPLVAKDEARGVIVVFPLKSKTPDPKRVQWFEAFAGQCAVAMELAQLQEEKEKLSPNDAVSGVLKRTIFLDLADREFRRCWRYDQPVSALIVDLDGMHGINLERGREFGDAVFREVASACRRTVRQIDLVGRYDGDSFAILLVMTGRDATRGAVDRLSAAIHGIRLLDDQDPVRVTATIGVSSYPREGCASIYDLLEAADHAQKAARHAGANQIFYA